LTKNVIPKYKRQNVANKVFYENFTEKGDPTIR